MYVNVYKQKPKFVFMKQNICKYILLFSVILGFAYTANAQNIDSLYSAYTKEKDQKIKNGMANSIISFCNKSDYVNFMNIKPEIIIEMATQYKNDSLLGFYCLYYSFSANKTGDNNKAFELACRSLKYFENIKDTTYISLSLKTIGFEYKIIKNYPEAIKYYSKAIDMFNTLNKKKRKIEWYHSFNYYEGFARIYLELHNIDSAFNKLQYAYNIFVNNEKDLIGSKKIDPDLRLNYLYANLYLQKKDTILAETYFKKCFAVNTDSIGTNTEHYLDACLLYSNFKKDKGDYKNALHYASLAYNFARKGKMKRFIAEVCEQLYKLYDETRQTDSAYYYLQQTLIYKDSINNAIVQSQIQNTILLLHLDEKEKEVRLAEDNIKHRQNVQYIALAIGIIILLLLFFLLSHSIIIGTRTIEFVGTITLLMVFELILLYIHPYLGKWSNESPLFMLLALVLIASILTPLHHNVEHWTKQKLIEKNKRVRLKHAKKTIKELEETDENAKTGQ